MDSCLPIDERRLRGQLDAGSALGPRLRQDLERAFGLDLARVRLHDDADADALATAVEAEAFTVGSDIFFRAGRSNPHTSAGAELLAHEIAHVGQQTLAGPGEVGTAADEVAALRAGRAFVGGRMRATGVAGRPVPTPDTSPLVVQCHSSWEHRMLGDVTTYDFDVLTQPGGHVPYFTRMATYLAQWQGDPGKVTRDDIEKAMPGTRCVTLRASQLLVTYGELNTLADYIASPAELDRLSAPDLLPILQQVRQEGWAWATWLVELSHPIPRIPVNLFAGAVGPTIGNETADTISSTYLMDLHTQAFGPRGTDRYAAVVGRNACHFAPHAWYRWEQYYEQAREFAIESYHAEGTRQARLENLAWIHHGYADHFLHDSFAAGHLVNKTLVMQWFVEAVATWNQPVLDWDLVAGMTATLQPGLAGLDLYDAFLDPARRGRVRDPQTGNEHWSKARRMEASGIRANGGTLGDAYQHYLAFLANTGLQVSSGQVHDHFNETALYVSSAQRPTPFQIYGDNTMLNGGQGFHVTSETAQRSQQSISELLATGTTTVTTHDLFSRFPTAVHPGGPTSPPVSLRAWHGSDGGLRSVATAQFGGAKGWVLDAIRMRIAPISMDSVGGWRWTQVVGTASDIAVGADGIVWSLGPAGRGRDGVVQRWNQGTKTWETTTGAGRRIAVDAGGTVWVVNADGRIYRKASSWESLPGSFRDVACGTDGSVFAVHDDGVTISRFDGAGGWQDVLSAPSGVDALSVGPTGLPWVVVRDGRQSKSSVLRLHPGSDTDHLRRLQAAGGATWTDVSPAQDCLDVGLPLGPTMGAWLTTSSAGILGWNGRASDPSSGALAADWEDLGGGATRVAVGPDGRPWVVNSAGSIYRLEPGTGAVVNFTSSDAGKASGSATVSGDALFPGAQISINGALDLSSIISLGDSGARVFSMRLESAPLPAAAVGYRYRLAIDGQGPSTLLGTMFIYFYSDTAGTKQLDWKSFFKHERQTLTDDFNFDGNPGIRHIRWALS